jgi:DNA-binding phage protein
MPTRSFHELMQEHVADDPAFAEALLREGIEAMLGGDVDTGKAILRDYIKATAGFEKLGRATRIPAKSLIRMFGPRGNPQARNLFGVIGYLQKIAGLRLQVTINIRSTGKPSISARKPRQGLSRRQAA